MHVTIGNYTDQIRLQVTFKLIKSHITSSIKSHQFIYIMNGSEKIDAAAIGFSYVI